MSDHVCDRRYRRELRDARGIFCCFVCDACKARKLAKFRTEIFEDAASEACEQIEED